MMEEIEYKPIVFAYYVNGVLMGFRADTFGTISEYPKIYGYSDEQIKIVMNNTKDMLNKAGTQFFKKLSEGNISVTNGESEIDSQSTVCHISSTEDTVRGWGEFEVKAHPFIGGLFERPEKWQMDAEIANLKPHIASQKFKYIQN